MTGTRCDEHRRARYRLRQRQRDPREVAFYGSSAWQRLARETVAAADRCAWCGTPGVRLTAGHIRSIRERPDLALEPGNVAASCGSCQRRMQVEPDPSKWPEYARRPRS